MRRKQMYDVTTEAIAKRKAAAKVEKKTSTKTVLALVGLLIVCCLWTCARQSKVSEGSKIVWNCKEFDAPLEVVWLKAYEVDVYGGVDNPQPSRVKGQAGGGNVVGIEARCNSSQGVFYRVRGADLEGKLWWGWVKRMDLNQ